MLRCIVMLRIESAIVLEGWRVMWCCVLWCCVLCYVKTAILAVIHTLS